jgi:hypothetical protein
LETGFAYWYVVSPQILVIVFEVGSLALPHLLISDDVYKGYRIPAKSIVIANVWAMMHDEVRYFFFRSIHAFNLTIYKIYHKGYVPRTVPIQTRPLPQGRKVQS